MHAWADSCHYGCAILSIELLICHPVLILGLGERLGMRPPQLLSLTPHLLLPHHRDEVRVRMHLATTMSRYCHTALRHTSRWCLGSYTDFPEGNTNWDSPRKDMAEDTLSPLPLPPLSNRMNTFTNGHSLSNCINCGWSFWQPVSTTTCTLT